MKRQGFWWWLRAGVILGVLFTTVTAAVPRAMATADTAPAVTLIAAEFGLFDVTPSGAVNFTPSSHVPHREGQRYGWMIELRTRLRSVSVREEYLVPVPTSTDGQDSADGNDGVTRLPRRNQVSQRQLVPVGGRIYGEWAIGAHEPPGKRQLQVIVEGELAGRFEYEVR